MKRADHNVEQNAADDEIILRSIREDKTGVRAGAIASDLIRLPRATQAQHFRRVGRALQRLRQRGAIAHTSRGWVVA